MKNRHTLCALVGACALACGGADFGQEVQSQETDAGTPGVTPDGADTYPGNAGGATGGSRVDQGGAGTGGIPGSAGTHTGTGGAPLTGTGSGGSMGPIPDAGSGGHVSAAGGASGGAAGTGGAPGAGGFVVGGYCAGTPCPDCPLGGCCVTPTTCGCQFVTPFPACR
jgi:hypothetical protein